MTRLIIMISGIILLCLTIINSYTSNFIVPSFQRAEVLAAASSVLLILITLFWADIDPNLPTRANLNGKEGIFIQEDLSEEIKLELAWGSKMILTASAAATLLIYWNKQVIFKRGIISEEEFLPKKICLQSMRTGNLISLVNTKFYPGKEEFDTVIKDLPSIVISPLNDQGVLLIGGWSERCFTKSDEIWIEGWSKKISTLLDSMN